jgi:DNA invertase Pin-like site-specific DNA recombinase
MKGVSRRDFDMVLAWSVDRLGRSLTGLLELHDPGAGIGRHVQGGS